MNILDQLQSAFPKLEFKPNFDLSQVTYFKLGGAAEVFVKIKDHQNLVAVVNFCREQNIKLTLLGGGSNVIIDDEGVAGLVVHPTNDELKVISETETDATIRVGVGLKTALLVRQTLDLGLEGLEYFLGVPGTVGGATYNNAHYLEDLIAEHITQVEVLTPQGEIKWLSAQECEFGYDTSRFQTSNEIILRVEFRLKKGEAQKSLQLVKEATQYRAQTQPLGQPSSGCIFQNVPNTPQLKKLFPQFAEKDYVSGGFLIDQAGLKGARVGDIEVSDKHAAFLINRGQGTAKDLKKMIELVKNTVKTKFGVELQEEVFYLS